MTSGAYFLLVTGWNIAWNVFSIFWHTIWSVLAKWAKTWKEIKVDSKNIKIFLSYSRYLLAGGGRVINHIESEIWSYLSLTSIVQGHRNYFFWWITSFILTLKSLHFIYKFARWNYQKKVLEITLLWRIMSVTHK